MTQAARMGRAVAARPMLRYRPISEDMLGEHAELSAAEYRDTPVCQVPHLAWKYCRNPQGTAYAYELRQDGFLRGRVLLQPRVFVDGTRQLRAANLVDLLIHPDHRGMSVFLALMRDVRVTGGFDFLYLVPNNASLALYRKVLRFTELCTLRSQGTLLGAHGVVRRLFGPRMTWMAPPLTLAVSAGLSALDACRRVVTRLHASEELPTASEFDAFIARLPMTDVVSGDRSFATFRWRFVESPVVRYQPIFFRCDGAMAGYAVCRHTMYEGLRTTFLVDLVLEPDLAPRDAARARWEIVGAARRVGSDIVFSLSARPGACRFHPVAFPLLPIPSRLLPQETPIFYVDLTPDVPKRVTRDTLFLTAADLDVF